MKSFLLLDSVIRSEANPVRDRLVLLLSDRKGSLGSERLLGRLCMKINN